MKFNRPTVPVTEISNEEFDRIQSIQKEAAKQEEIKELSQNVQVKKTYSKAMPTVAVNARSNPDARSDSLGVIYPGEIYDVEDFDDEWYLIASGSKKGAYVRKEYMK